MKTKTAIKKRLFLFAAYDKSGVIDSSLIYYIKTLSKFGDIVFFMDSDTNANELEKLKSYTIYADGIRHGEYDFGSYKRAYQWAKANIDTSKYDYIYLVNDSVYGPLYDMDRYFRAMEGSGHDAFGLVKNPHKEHPHIQSWFVGLTQDVFSSDWFDHFIQQVTKLANKGEITHLYEHGLSRKIVENGYTWDCLYSVPGRGIYNKVKRLYLSGVPFIKRVAFTRNHGALGGQIKYILNHISMDASDAIKNSAERLYGTGYIKWLLTKNPLKIIYRNIKHALHKIFIEGL